MLKIFEGLILATVAQRSAGAMLTRLLPYDLPPILRIRTLLRVSHRPRPSSGASEWQIKVLGMSPISSSGARSPWYFWYRRCTMSGFKQVVWIRGKGRTGSARNRLLAQNKPRATFTRSPGCSATLGSALLPSTARGCP
ncbi:hypothetical protein B0H17DRAFT_1067119, partial [Mycena rosella]